MDSHLDQNWGQALAFKRAVIVIFPLSKGHQILPVISKTQTDTEMQFRNETMKHVVKRSMIDSVPVNWEVNKDFWYTNDRVLWANKLDDTQSLFSKAIERSKEHRWNTDVKKNQINIINMKTSEPRNVVKKSKRKNGAC